MSDRDIHGIRAGSGAECCADNLTAIQQLAVVASRRANIAVVADEAGLGAADRWQAEDEAEVRGDAAASWVGDALAIDEDQVGGALQTGEGGEEDRGLAKREQARYGGEGGCPFSGGLPHGVEFWIAEDHHGTSDGSAPRR